MARLCKFKFRMRMIETKPQFWNRERWACGMQPQYNDSIKRRIRWKGHELRMDDNRNPQKNLKTQIQREKSSGKLKKKRDTMPWRWPQSQWTINSQEDKRLTLEEIVRNWEQWKDVIGKSVTGNIRMIKLHVCGIPNRSFMRPTGNIVYRMK